MESFLAFDGQELVGRDIVRQVEAAVAHQHGRPDDGVEEDVVLADEVVALGIALPRSRATFSGSPLVFGPFLAGGEVADDGLEPDVDALVLKAGHRHRDAPFDVAGDGPVLQPSSR